MKANILNSVIGLILICPNLYAENEIYLNDDAPIEQRIDDALSRMTLEEKVALCHGQGKFSSAGVRRLGIPELWWSDGPHGVRAEVNWNNWGNADWKNDSSTVFPALTALASTWNPSLAGLYGKSVGEEARYRDKDVLMGPGLNIYRTPLCGRNFEYMGEDPVLAGEMAVPYVRELQKNGVAASVKHFAVNNQEKWRENVDVEVSERALYEIYLPAFKKAITEGGAWTVMGAYNRIGGTHACHNYYTLNKILRDEWGFDGVVVSDWGGTHNTEEAALNGLDVEMATGSDGMVKDGEFTYDDYYLARPFRDAIKAGVLPDSAVNAKARNILRLIFRTAMNSHKPHGAMTSPEHYTAARHIAEEAIVLLKNNGILPLDPSRYKKILVVGENATRLLNEGGGSSELKAKDMFTPLDAIKEVYSHVDYQPGYMSGRAMWRWEDTFSSEEIDSLRNEAVGRAADYDAVIYIGGLNKNAWQDCEGVDRREYSLPWEQNRLIEELINANPNTVIANMSGNAYEMPWINKAPAVLQTWYLGTMAGPAIASVISGEVNPSGKLPFSFPRKLEDNGAHHFGEISYPGIDRKTAYDDGTAFNEAEADPFLGINPHQKYLEDILVGYRWHDTKKIPALFPFGHGLSYTKFTYGKAILSSSNLSEGEVLDLTVTVTNAGAVEGKEVVQVYIGDDKASVIRPLKELKKFSKVALKPMETKELSFKISTDDLKFYDEKTRSWIAEPGSFKIYIGSSSTDIRQILPFRLKSVSK